MNKLLKLVNTFGFFTKDQYLRVQDENNELKKQAGELPYDFDRLVKEYRPQQLNAFVYKAFNECYSEKTKNFLLERWYIRLKGACIDKGIKIE